MGGQRPLAGTHGQGNGHRAALRLQSLPNDAQKVSAVLSLSFSYVLFRELKTFVYLALMLLRRTDDAAVFKCFNMQSQAVRLPPLHNKKVIVFPSVPHFSFILSPVICSLIEGISVCL